MSKIRTVLIFAAPIALTACATTGEPSAARATPQRAGAIDTHHEYVAHVESVARRRGIDVTWVHPPIKRAKADD